MTRAPLGFALLGLLGSLGLLGCGGGRPAPASPPLAGTAGASAPAAGCMPVPWRDTDTAGEATYRGKLDLVEAEDANGQKEKPFVITLDRPACLPAGNDAKETAEIQVYSPDPALQQQLQAAVGKTVAVTGEGFTAHTAHHHRPIVVDVKRISAQ